MSECFLDLETYRKCFPKDIRDDMNHPQCCCNCYYHLEDRYHASINPKEYYDKDISNVRGYICAIGLHGEWATEGKKSVASSGWEEHSIGCELHTIKG